MSITVKTPDRQSEQGQIIVIFALALVAIIAMVGLVLDGGSAFAQRRDQQSASDLAALAGANDYWLWSDTAQATARARTIAATNGYQDGALVTVDIGAPHRNTFSSILGMANWNVATTAQAQAGIADTANGAAPILFSVDVFGTTGQPKAAYGNPAAPFEFGIINGDVPAGANDIAWTDYGAVDNVNSDDVRDIINGSTVINVTLSSGDDIGQKNNGYHNTLFGDVNDHLQNKIVPVPVVDDHGIFQGWASFHIVSANQGNKTVKGYFESPYVNDQLTIKSCALGSCPRYFGDPTFHLVK